jgi:hypothetical protein
VPKKRSRAGTPAGVGRSLAAFTLPGPWLFAAAAGAGALALIGAWAIGVGELAVAVGAGYAAYRFTRSKVSLGDAVRNGARVAEGAAPTA